MTEYRSCSGQEFRAVANATEKIIEGHAAVFNRQTDVGGYFFEIIEVGAFDNADLRDVPLIVNHDFSKIPLARSNGTLTLAVDETGLSIRAVLDTENNSDARALYSAVERGDLQGMSFCFSVDAEEWQDLESEMPTRRIKSISKVFEVSACTFPQYDATDIQARAKNLLSNALEILKLKNKILGAI